MKTSGASVHIVVGFDFSPLAELALREAAMLAVDRPDIAIRAAMMAASAPPTLRQRKSGTRSRKR